MEQLTKSQIQEKVRLLMDEQGLNESEFSAFETNDEEHDDSRLDEIIEGKALEALRYVYQNADEALVPWKKFTSTVYAKILPFDGFVNDVDIIQTGATLTPIGIFYDSPNNYFVAQILSPSTSPRYYTTWLDGEDYMNPSPDYLYHDTSADKYYAYKGSAFVEVTESGIVVENDNSFVTGYTAMHVSFGVATVWRWRAVGLSSWNRMVPLSDAIDISTQEYAMLHNPLCTGTWERPRVGLDYSSNGETKLTLLSQKENSDKVVMDFVEKPEWKSDAGSTEEQYLIIGDKLVDAFLYYLAGLTCMILGDERQGGFFQQSAELMGKITNVNQE